MTDDFDKFFNIYENIYSDRKDEIEEYKAKLIKKHDKSYMIALVTSPLCLLTCAICIIKLIAFGELLCIIGVVGAIFLSAYTLNIVFYSKNEHQLKFKKRIKCIFMNDLLSYFGNLKWSRTLNNAALKELIIKSNAFKPFSSVLFDDIFKGHIEGAEVLFAETKLSNNEYTENNPLNTAQQVHPDINYYEMAKNCSFKGLIMFFKLGKEIKNQVIIAPRENIFQKIIKSFSFAKVLKCVFLIFSVIFLHFLISCEIELSPAVMPIVFICALLFWYKYIQNKNSLEVKLEHNEFNKQFSVYACDEAEARRILTPVFINLLYDFKKVFSAKNMKCSFFDDRFMIAVENKKDLFELGDLFSTYSRKCVKNFYNEISLIVKTVEYFNIFFDK